MDVSWTVLNNCAPVNATPTTDAGGAYNGAEGATISLDGTGSSDDGSIVSYAWTVTPQAGGPDAGAICSFVGGTSSTDSPAATSCCANSAPVPVAPSIAQVRGSKGAANLSSRSHCDPLRG